MNRGRMLLVGLLALLASGLVSVFSYRLLQAQLQPRQEETRIVVAARKLPLGTRLAPEHLRLAPWSSRVPLEGSFQDPNRLVGRGVIVALAPNEPVLESKLAPEGAGAGLTSAIPTGMRAVAVKVNVVIGVAGFVLPGTRVDVILTGEHQREETSRVILENIQVLAADQNVEQDINGTPREVQVITLLVTPEEAQKLALASVDGRIQLALRNPLDFEHTHPAPVQKSALYTAGKPEPPARRVSPPTRKAPPSPAPAPPAEAPAPKRIHVVELIQGETRQTQSFELNP